MISSLCRGKSSPWRILVKNRETRHMVSCGDLLMIDGLECFHFFLIVHTYIGKDLLMQKWTAALFCTVSSECPLCSLHSLFLETIDIL